MIATLLDNRGVAGAEGADFFDPLYANSHNPFLLSDMDRAVTRIAKALEKKEKICVYADYDADAVTAAAVLLRFFQALGQTSASYYIPDRFAEGYGVSSDAISMLKARDTDLIITVDCGINAVEAVDLANSLGIDVIVTDHHQLTGQLPKAVGVINPHQPGDKYPYKDLTGAGVAFKLVQGLAQSKQHSINSGWEKWLLDLVAIGTVADCQSLLGENRIFVKWGLHVLQKTKWLGLKKLIRQAGLVGINLETYHLGFMIAPRLNAAGRIEHANLALELLLTDDEMRADDLSQKLNELNKHRQNLTEQILSEAREQLGEVGAQKILLAAGDGWPKGVVGLVAGKLTEEFSRPVLILEKSGDQATGSARSIRSFNIVEAIGRSESILVKYGGHPMAAGFTIKSEHIEVFHKNLLEYAEETLTSDDLSPILEYDTEASIQEIGDGLVNTLDKFAPFGLGNPRPRLRINNLIPKNISQIGKEGKHLRMYVSRAASPLVEGDRGELLGCIGFGLGFWASKLNEHTQVDIICEPQFNEWNGAKKTQLKIIDIHVAEPSATA